MGWDFRVSCFSSINFFLSLPPRCKNYRPVSVAVIHHPVHHECQTDDLNEDEDERSSPIPTQLCPPVIATEPDTGSAPITIWRSESPADMSREDKATKKIKKKEVERDDEVVDEKAKAKKKAKKCGKLVKKKSPVKSESSPADFSTSPSPRTPVRTSESSPESREELESEDSYERSKEGPSSEEIVESSSSPSKKEKSTAQAKKNGTKNLQTRKVTKRKSPPVPNPNLS